MIGISSTGKGLINKAVEEMFDRIALHFIGNIPKLKNTKRLIISSKPNYGLAHLFIQAMQNKQPNAIEEDVLKGLLETSHGYIESLKSKTVSNVTDAVDGLVKEAKLKDRTVNPRELRAILDDHMSKAKSHLKAIAESEATKLRNVGTMMDISRVAATIGDEDPTVFFIIVRDNVTCKECLRLHTVDGGAPRLWKFSELKQGYHKRGENNPSAFGLHPHCRCTLTYLSKGFGFDKAGKLTYVGENHDAHAKQINQKS